MKFAEAALFRAAVSPSGKIRDGIRQGLKRLTNTTAPAQLKVSALLELVYDDELFRDFPGAFAGCRGQEARASCRDPRLGLHVRCGVHRRLRIQGR